MGTCALHVLRVLFMKPFLTGEYVPICMYVMTHVRALLCIHRERDTTYYLPESSPALGRLPKVPVAQ